MSRISYPKEIKMKAIGMRLAGVPVKEVMAQIHIRKDKNRNLDEMV
ncbi:hypothetical protein NV379_07705 [Paenibacillus sp. N1-5-1-14]|nr:hypothetical protein [Paenibacillus radicibacter]MCR8642547.1 hypothetical protein [Paenibacillus radicibacter]